MKIVVLLVMALSIALVCTHPKTLYKVYKIEIEPVYESDNDETNYVGHVATVKEFPFMIFIAMLEEYGIARCSASLVHSNFVLTAAHCVATNNLPPRDVVLVGGNGDLTSYQAARLKAPPDEPVNEKELGLQERRAVAVYKRRKYNSETYFYDFALIRLKKPFNSPNIKIIPLFKVKSEKPKDCKILGWSRLKKEPEKLRLIFNIKRTETPKIECQKMTKDPLLCVEPIGMSACMGDAGGPFVCENEVWGGASSYNINYTKTCAEAQEHYYSNVYSNFEWIDKQMKSGLSPSAVVSIKNMLVLTAYWFF